jgi:hypothetical protein
MGKVQKIATITECSAADIIKEAIEYYIDKYVPSRNFQEKIADLVKKRKEEIQRLEEFAKNTPLS